MSVVTKHILSGELSSQLTKALRREDLVASSFNRWRACPAIQQHDLHTLRPCSVKGFIIISSKITPSILRLDIAIQSCILDA